MALGDMGLDVPIARADHRHDADYAPLVHTHPEYALAVHSHPLTGGASGRTIDFHPPFAAASAAATNNVTTAVTAVADPNYRRFEDLRGLTKCRLLGRFGGTVHTSTKLRIQYHTGGNPAIATGDAGWATLCESAGSHAVGTMFYSAEVPVPLAAQINHCLLRAVIAGGDGLADPTLTCCLLNVYP